MRIERTVSSSDRYAQMNKYMRLVEVGISETHVHGTNCIYGPSINQDWGG